MMRTIVNLLVFLLLLFPAAPAQGDPLDDLIVEDCRVCGTVTGGASRDL